MALDEMGNAIPTATTLLQPSQDGPHWGDLLSQPSEPPSTPAVAALPVSEEATPSSPSNQAVAPWMLEVTAESTEPSPAPVVPDPDRTVEWESIEHSSREASNLHRAAVAPWVPAPPADGTLPPAAVLSSPRPSRKLPASVWLLSILIPYALALTAAVVYFATRERPPHPLEAIQDQGLYEDIAFDGRRREGIPNAGEDSKDPRKQDRFSPTNELPAWFPRVKLGETQRYGSIEVTPLRVSREKLKFASLSPEREAIGDQVALVLYLRLKNVGNLYFHPHDVTFNRAAKRDVYTFLEVGDDRFYGAIKDPLVERLQGQSFSELPPGGEMETTVVAFESEAQQRAVDALAKASPDSPLTWRVHLRKGREEVALRQGGRRLVWLTTIVAVVFTPTEVKAFPNDQ
jgi:hypothetical protein